MNPDFRWCFALATAIALSACDGDDPGVEQTALSSSGSLKTKERSPTAGSVTSNWPTHGRTYGEQRFSSLEQVNAENVRELGLDRFFDIPTHRGIEATPLVIDDVMPEQNQAIKAYIIDRAHALLPGMD